MDLAHYTTSLGSISKSDIESISIPLPTIEHQKKIVEYLDFVHETNETSNKKITELKRSNEYYLSNQIKYGKNELKQLSELCEFLPKSKRNAGYGNIEGKYKFYTSSQSCTKYCDEYDYVDYSLIIGTGGNANIKYGDKFSCSADNYVLKINDLYVSKYVYYYLLLNMHILQNGFAGSTIKHISKDYIQNIQIPLPSNERQKEIVDYLDNNLLLIETLEKDIEKNKLLAEQFLKTAIKSGDIIEE
jgi:restriction endonuclease S subunit